MTPVASSLASKLNPWVKIDDSFTTDGKIVVMSGLQQKYLVFQEVTVRTTCTKNKQLSYSKKQVLLTQMQQSSTPRCEFFKDMCNWMVSANIPWIKLPNDPILSFLEKYCKQYVPDQLTLRKYYLPICL
jgi:hypothetical protein